MTDAQFVENKFYGPVDARRARFGIVDSGAAEVPPPRTAADAARLLFGNPPEPVAGSPVRWLDPRAEIVPAQDRPEVSVLVAWCTGRAGPMVRLVCGQGGQGKTRLALTLCDRLAPDGPATIPQLRWQRSRRYRGWLAGFVRLPELSWQACGDAERDRWRRLVAAVRAVPTLGVTGALLVVDYPEGHREFVEELVYEAIRAGASSRIRVLLLARAEPDWWRNVTDVAAAGTVDPDPLALESLPAALASTGAGEAAVTGELWKAAVEAFADRAAAANLLPAAPDTVAVLTAQPPGRFDTTLDLYADALLRVLDHGAAPADRAGAGNDPLRGLLHHERRLFARGAGLTWLDTGLRRDLAVSVAFLHPAAGKHAATQALAAVPELSQLSQDQLERTAQALAVAYPPDADDTVRRAPRPDRLPDTHLPDAAQRSPDNTVWRAPRPDRLPDTHLLDTAQRCPDWCGFVAAVCGVADPAVAGHAARVLVRALSTPAAAARYPAGLRRLEQSITVLLRQRPAEYVPLLVELDPVRFGRTLIELLGDPALPTASVARIDTDLRATGFTTTRTAIAVAVSRRLAADTRPPAGDPLVGDPLVGDAATHADHLVLLSRRLAEAGEVAAALPPAREAVDRYRRLPEPSQNAHRAGFATALTNLGNRLAEHGDAAEALAITGEAAELRRELADAGGTRGELAYAMNNLALRLLDTGRPEQAVAPAREAVELLDRLAAADSAHRPRLAIALTSLARVLAAAARPREAIAPAERAVHILRELADLQPASYLPDLAAGLITLSQHLAPAASRGKRTKPTIRAVELATEAADIYHRLDSDLNGLPTFRADLASALTNLGLRQADAASPDHAVAQTRRAVTIWHELAQDHPGLHRADLAASLTNLALQLVISEGGAVALEPATEAATLYRAAAPGESSIGLAAALSNLGYVLAAAGRLGAAVTATGEAVTIYRRLLTLADDPQANHRIWLADALVNLARHHTATGGAAPPHAQDTLLEAIDLYAQVAHTHPDAGYDRFRAALALLAVAGSDTAVNKVPSDVPAPSHKDADRYCRRWHEVAVRSSLPGIAAVAVWRTDLAPRLQRRRTLRDELIALLDRRNRLATTGAEPGPPAARLPTITMATTATSAASTASASDDDPSGRLVTTAALATVPVDVAVHPGRLVALVTKATDRLRSAATTTASRVARVPGVNTVIQYVQANPAALARMAGVIAVAAAIFTAMPSPNPAAPLADPPTPTPSVVAVTPPPTTQPSTSPPAPPPTSSQPPTTEPPTPQPPANSPAPAVQDAPSPTNTTTSPAPTPTNTSTSPTTPPPTSPSQSTSPTSLPPPPPSTFVIAINASATSYLNIALSDDPTWKDAKTEQRFTLPPGAHQLRTQDGPSIPFTITPTGLLDYDPQYDPIFTGRGTASLTLHGLPIKIDATAVSYARYGLVGVWTPRDQSPEFVLVPGPHGIALYDRYGAIPFEVTAAGLLDYDPQYDPIFTGRGTATLTVHGVTRITVNIMDTSYAAYDIAGNFTARERSPELNLVPGPHRMSLWGRYDWLDFDITPEGRINYPTVQDSFLAGRNTTALTVHGITRITANITDTSYAGYAIAGNYTTRDQSPEFNLIPGAHSIGFVGRDGGIPFEVTAAGLLDYDPQYDPIFTGRGTATLAVHGTARITVNIGDTSYTAYGIAGNATGRERSPEFALVPGPHNIGFAGRNDRMPFEVTAAGLIDYDPQYDPTFAGRGTTTLTVRGIARITANIGDTSYPFYDVAGNYTRRDRSPEFALAPGLHVIAFEGRYGGIPFEVTAAGLLDYDPQYDPIFTGRGTTTLAVHGITRITASIGGTSYAFYGVAGNYTARDQSPEFNLIPGAHSISFVGRDGGIPFEVTAAGLLDYDPQYDPIFTGRGTATLAVHGITRITANITDTSYTAYDIAGNYTARDRSPEFSLIPGLHRIGLVGRCDLIDFDITPEGRINYPAERDSFLAGRNTTALTVHGITRITANITDTSYAGYGIAGNYTARDQSTEFNLIPGAHNIALDGRDGGIPFEVTVAGLIDYDIQYDPIFTGRGTPTIAVHGLPINIDAHSATFASFSIPGVTGPVDARQLHTFSVLPGTHQVVPSAGATIAFSVTVAGNVDYDASLDDVLDGRGTPTLLFRGPTSGLLLPFVIGVYWCSSRLAGRGNPLLLTVNLVEPRSGRRQTKIRPRPVYSRWVSLL